MREQEHLLLLSWLTLAGLVVFGLSVCVDQGLLADLLATDQSKISILILGLFALGVVHSFLRTLYLSRQLNMSVAIEQRLQRTPGLRIAADGTLMTADEVALPAGFVADYLVDVMRATHTTAPSGQAADARIALLEASALKLRGPHEFGWYLIDTLMKVGFLGTLIGFIMMLGSISGSANLDAGMLQQVLQKMSHGMSTALNTTLVSLVGAILLSIPYYLLDRALDELVAKTLQLSEVQVLPQRTNGV